MSDLARQVCEPCRADSPRVEPAECTRLLAELPGWVIEHEGNVPVLQKTFRCRDFRAALEIANRIGDLADAEDHHPRLVVEWGRVAVAWWTHAIGGLHRNDFIMAARTEALAEALAEALTQPLT
ncbi:MAG: 4a-hydroxytetrahydrobiopterin dehydratase [Pseudomonadales bacterium]|nr:4a-hydroxytetrahydrobiopterin dehydratase [Pseudomonadales bacterium]